MPKVPAPNEFGVQFENQMDPRIAGALETLRRECKLDERVKQILATHPELTNEEKTSFDVNKIGKACAYPVVTAVDTPNAFIEIAEIDRGDRSHLVYYVQPKKHVDYPLFCEKVAKPALGAVWDQFQVEGWLERLPGDTRWEIWGVVIFGLKLNGMNDNFFKGLIPKAFSDQIGKLP